MLALHYVRSTGLHLCDAVQVNTRTRGLEFCLLLSHILYLVYCDPVLISAFIHIHTQRCDEGV